MADLTDQNVLLPFQVSPYVTATLFHVCTEIQRSGSHAPDAAVLRALVTALLDSLRVCYSALLERLENANKEALVQLWIDVAFVGDVLARNSDDPALGDMLVQLRTKLDPIDVEFYRPFVSEIVRHSYCSSAALLGCLMPLHRLHKDSRASLPDSALPLAPISVKLPMLPSATPERVSSRNSTPPARSQGDDLPSLLPSDLVLGAGNTTSLARLFSISLKVETRKSEPQARGWFS